MWVLESCYFPILGNMFICKLANSYRKYRASYIRMKHWVKTEHWRRTCIRWSAISYLIHALYHSTIVLLAISRHIQSHSYRCANGCFNLTIFTFILLIHSCQHWCRSFHHRKLLLTVCDKLLLRSNVKSLHNNLMWNWFSQQNSPHCSESLWALWQNQIIFCQM